MASGVLSSGSTLIPPVQNTISAPASIARKHPSVIFCHHHQTPHETSSVHQTLLFFLDNRGKRILYPAMVHFVSGCDYRCFSDHERLYIKNRSVIAYVRSRLQLILFMTSGMILVPASLSPFSQWYCRASLLLSFHQRS